MWEKHKWRYLLNLPMESYLKNKVCRTPQWTKTKNPGSTAKTLSAPHTAAQVKFCFSGCQGSKEWWTEKELSQDSRKSQHYNLLAVSFWLISYFFQEICTIVNVQIPCCTYICLDVTNSSRVNSQFGLNPNISYNSDQLQPEHLKISRPPAELQLQQWFCWPSHTNEIKFWDKMDNFFAHLTMIST